ncbi:heterokaryon incompatibility protein-domain-containing protein [Triangularia setosa]|uniref:Heterokaryon incompatibility protein-domain-containing protein n=1 Tax=Triangularia setosa TaxID=2587417 RepID=A0AAN6VYQ6_9PEZI|nr:heterokaryon incompatibility protein-domain-containing protein [Podospora setosa]
MQQKAKVKDEWECKEWLLPPKELPNEANPYQHHKLSSDSEIRLVTIKPGTWRDPISCTLSCHSLDFLPLTEYSALSYAWGSPGVTDMILLEGRSWPVTVNLANALYFLRDPIKPVRMWIDALCIDQSDLKERGKQVQLMKEIYSSGTQVVVYLGDGKNHRPKRLADQQINGGVPVWANFHNNGLDEAHIEDFWEALTTFINSSSMANSSNRHLPRLRRRPLSSTFHMFCLLRILGDEALTWKLVDTMGKISDTSIDPLGTLIENLRKTLLNPWWQRIWVVQEMIVSRVAVVRCGTVKCPWEIFILAASAISRPSFDMFALFHPDSAKVLQYFCRQVLSFRDLRNQWQKNLGAPMLTLLQDFSARRATDERDKVFALLGLSLPAQRFLVQTSYEDTVADVYRATAVELIRRSQSLDIWRGDLARKNRRDLSSWVPDWSAVYDEADRRRAQFADGEKGRRKAVWKLTVVKSEGEYWKFVAEGMTLLLHWINEKPKERKLPERLQEVFKSYRQALEADGLRLYRKWEATALITTVERIQELCCKLESHCSWRIDFGDLSKDPSICAFGRSATFYREVKAQLSTPFEERRDDLSFGKETGDWLDRMRVGYDTVIFHTPESDNAIFTGFKWYDKDVRRRNFLSMESVPRGTVAHVGDRLFSWDDRSSAFSTISKWVSYYERMPGYQKIKMAKTLLGGASFAKPRRDIADIDIVGGEGERITDALLLEWLDHILQREDFQNDTRMKPFNEALVLATAGRVMFTLKDSTLGLGPASMAVGDEVKMLPGARSPIMLRFLLAEHGDALEGPAYTVVGDCYLDSPSSDSREKPLKPWPGWLPETMLPSELKGFWERRRIYLF